VITINKRYTKILNEVKSIFPYIEDTEQKMIAKRIYQEGLLPDFMSPTNLIKSIAGEYGTDIGKLMPNKTSKQIQSKIAARALMPDYHNHTLVKKVAKNFLIKTDSGYLVDPEIENKLGSTNEVVRLLKKFADKYTDFVDQPLGSRITSYAARADLGKLANDIQNKFFIKIQKDSNLKKDKDLEDRFDKTTASMLTPEFWRGKININRLTKKYPMEKYLDKDPDVQELKQIMRDNPKTSYAYRNALNMFEKMLVQKDAYEDPKKNPIGYFFNRTSEDRAKGSKWKSRWKRNV